METSQRLEVEPAEAGLRLDRWLARRLGLTRGYVRRLLERGVARLDGRPAAKGTVLHAGERVELAPFRRPECGVRPSPEVQLGVLARGCGLLAVEKPAGLPSHPLDYDEAPSALGAVAAVHPEVARVGGGGLQAGLVHRLDTATSGVLVFALEEAAWERGRAALRAHQVDKRYLARVHGRLDAPHELRLELAQRGERVVVVARGGRETLTRIEPLEPGDRSSLVEVRPATGMRHQVRVTLAHLGHPVVGDRLYGSTAGLGRHLLHSARFRLGGFDARSAAPDELLRADPGQPRPCDARG